MADTASELCEKARAFEKELKKYFPEQDNNRKIIYEAMEYSLFAGGKRLRPVLMLEVCKMCGGDITAAMPFACAVEMIHTYSLIHDDLPAMDNDSLRRGRPTSHVKFGEGTAVLAGDALLNKAFEIVSEQSGKDPAATVRAIHELAISSGTEGMIGGQIIDITSENTDLDIEELRNMHLLKTGAIIRSACRIGAITAGASAEDISRVDDYAENLGTAFQICDDILDFTGDEAKLGKHTGKDEKDNKNTYIKLLGLERSKQAAEKYSHDAGAALEPFGERADFLIRLAEYLVNRDK